ncbi:MAG: glycerophosphodiester phosphodiesterase [Planctomycetota bacterium]|nr:MAG: glycerophosphodiester phosphodiesterase [Planctomycetota bacterium]
MSFLVFHRANSLGALERAKTAGVQWIEFDIRRTSEGELVLFHDGEVKGAKTKDLSRKELEDMGEIPIVSLEEVLKNWHQDFCMDLELKEEGYEAEVVDLALQYLHPSQMVFTSFWRNSVREIKKRYPFLKVGLLVARNWPEKKFSRWIPTVFPIRKAMASGADFLAPHYFFLSMGIVSRAYAKGLPLWFWTVNKVRTYIHLEKFPGIEGIITDHPEWGQIYPSALERDFPLLPGSA